MQRRSDLVGTLVLAIVFVFGLGVLLWALQLLNVEGAPAAPGFDSLQEVPTDNPSTEEPWRDTAWWKLTEEADMATLGAQTVSPEELSRTPDMSTPVSIPHFVRPAGFGDILTGSGPAWGAWKFQTTGRWQARLSTDKVMTVLVGFESQDWLQRFHVSRLLVQYWEADDFKPLPGGGAVDSILQDPSLSIIDADQFVLRLRTTANLEMEFDPLTLTQAQREQPIMMTRVTPSGVIREEGVLAVGDPDIDIYNTWAGTIHGQGVQIGAGQRVFHRDGSRTWGSGIVVLTTDLAPLTAHSSVEQIDVQDSYGPLKIFNEVEDKLILIDLYGYEYVFDPVLKTIGLAGSDPSFPRGTVYVLPTPRSTGVP